MHGAIETEFGGERLVLLPGRAAWWGRERTVFIADTHFGKAAAFRRAGLPVPETVTGADVDALAGLVSGLGAQRLVILGDFFHAPSGRVAVMEGCIGAWREALAGLEVVLVRGNHDVGSGDPPAEWGFVCVEPGERLGPFVLAHTPEEAAGFGGAALCGHVHPGVVMKGDTGAARLRCFHERGGVMTLPAFGRFTGMGTIYPRAGDGVFVIVDGEVVDVSPRQKRGTGGGEKARYDWGMKTEAKTG